MIYSAYGYAPEVHLHISGDDYDHAISLFKGFLSEYGLTCRRDLDAVLTGVKRARQEIPVFHSCYRWNGELLNSNEAIRRAITAEHARIDAMYALYEAVKDAPSVDANNRQEMELAMHFAPLTANTATGVVMNGTTVTVQSVTVGIEDPTLLVENEPYRVEFALKDANGALVHFEQTGAAATAFTGTLPFNVTANDLTLTLPVLAAGNYTLVAYLSTADGIRSSAHAPVAVERAENTESDLGTVVLHGTVQNGTLSLVYTSKTNINVALTSDTALDYNAFEALMKTEAFTYGIPADGLIEMQSGDTFTPMTGSETAVSSGTYRIVYTIENGSTHVQGYLTVTYTAP